MNSLFGRIAAGAVARTSLLLDLLALVLAAIGATLLSGYEVTSALSTFGLAAIGTWLITAMALRHYDPWASDRMPFDDGAMTSILVLAVTTVLAVMVLVLPGAGLPNVGIFLLVSWPMALVLRATVFRTFSPRSGPIDEVLVVGTGPLARATLDDLRKKGRHDVLGMVRFTDEAPAQVLKARVLGSAADFESVLRSVPVAEVYFASTHSAHAAEIQNAVKVCERFGVPFAMPAVTFRLERARPLASHGVGDGYIHYQSVQSKPIGMAFKRLFDIVSSGVALWVLAPLLLVVAVVVKLTSRGPLLFRQQRTGLHGRPFQMLKFRTLVE